MIISIDDFEMKLTIFDGDEEGVSDEVVVVFYGELEGNGMVVVDDGAVDVLVGE